MTKNLSRTTRNIAAFSLIIAVALTVLGVSTRTSRAASIYSFLTSWTGITKHTPAPAHAPAPASAQRASLAPQVALTGTKNIPGDYATLAAAITDLNAQGVGSGGVTFNVTAAQTAPAGGYVIGGTGSLVLTTASAANPIVFTGNGNTVTAPTPQASGALNDAIFKLIGADFVTIQGFTMQENAANTTTAAGTNNMTEFGVALFYVTTTDGSQNNTIQNNTITLNRAYQNTFGIYSNTRHSSTSVTTTADITAPGGSNSNNKVYGNNISNVDYAVVIVGSSTTANMDTGNDIGGSSAATGNTVTNFGTNGTAISGYISVTSSSFAMYLNHQLNDNASFNTITSAAGLSTATVQHGGIVKAYSTAAPTAGTVTTTTINNNTVTINNSPTTGQMTGVSAQGATANSAATISLNNNLITGSITGAATSAAFLGVFTSSGPGTLNINGNTVRGVTTNATTGAFVAIQQQTNGVVTTLNINNNKIGDAVAGAVTFSNATNSGAATGIAVTSTGAASTAAVSISTNDIRGIVHTTTGSGAHLYFSNAAASLSQNISNNTFTNLNVNTTGSIIFISDNVSLTATGTKNINSNSIVTAFNKGGAGGTITLYNDGASSVTGSVSNNNNNNFSNFTFTGATAFNGWFNQDGLSATSGPTKTISGNTFSNISGGSGAIQVLTSSFGGGTNTVNSNTVSNVTGAGQILGLVLGSSSNTTNASLNTISTLSTTGASGVAGVLISGGTTVNAFRNKVYDLQANNASGFVNGMQISGGTTITASNNLIGDLRTPTANAATPLIGISILGGTTVNAYYNTVYLNGASTGALFGSSAIFAVTTTNVTLIDNIFANNSSVTGAGLAAAYRRSDTTISTYGSASNNNDFFGSTIYTDGTNTFTTLAAYKTFVAPRDSNAVSVNPSFITTTGSLASFLHLNPAVSSPLINGGIPVSGITTDFDGDTRDTTTPDIGADEVTSIQFSSATYSVNEGAGTATITVTRTAGSANAATVNYATSDGTAAAGSDYTATSGTLNFAAGDTSKTFTISITDDAIYEGNETVNITLSNATGGSPLGTPSTAVLTIVDNDTAPTISISGVTVSEGAGTATFVVTQSAASSLTTTFTYSTADGTATAGTDYTGATNAPASIPAGSTTTNINIPITDDSLYEGSETFTVTISNATNATIAAGQGTATGTITDNDTAPAFSIDDITHNEGDSGTTSYTFTVTKTGSTALNASVDYATVDGTATAPSDYTAITPAQTLTFLPGDTAKQITVLVNGDTTFEPDETFSVHLSNANGATIADADGTGTITNDDVRPQPNTVYVDDDFASLPNGSDPPGPGTEIGYDSFATVQGGVTGVAPGGTVNVASGNYPEQVTISKSLTLVGEGAATTNITTPASLTPGIGGNVVLVQVDSGATVNASGITIAGPRVFNGCPANTFYGVFVVGGANLNLHDATVKDIRLADPALFGCQDGIAIRAGSEGLAQAATLTLNNTNVNGYQKGAIIIDGTGTTGTITNSTLTGAGPANIGANAIQISRNATATVTGNTITGNQCNNAACGPDPFTQAFSTGILIFSTPNAVQITNNNITNNDAGIYNNGANTTVSNNTFTANRYEHLFLDEGAATINDNTMTGAANVGVSVASFEGNTGNSTGTLTHNTITGATTGVQLLDDTSGSDAFSPQLTAHFNRIIATTTAIDNPQSETADLENNWWGCNAGPGNTGCGAVTGAGADFDPWFVLAVTATPNTIIPGGTSNIAVDMTHNSAGAVPAMQLPDLPVSYSATNGTVTPPTGTVTNGTANSTFTSTNGNSAVVTTTVDNQSINSPITVNAPSFTIDDVTHVEGNSGTTAYTFTVTKTGATNLSSSVNFTTVDGTATVADNDYAANSGTLTFAANETTMTITVLVNGDTNAEADETFTVHLSNAVNAGITDADGTGTIQNDDNSGTFQFSAANYTINESRPTATITVTRTGSTSSAATIHYATSDGTATAGADYDTTSGDLNFANGDTSKTFTVGIINDTDTESNETVTLTLSSPSTGATLGTPNPATLTIVDNDGAASSNVVVVTPTNLQGWAAFNEQTASAAFVNGPATPPYGSGSYQELTGAGTGPNAGGKSYFKTDNYNGTRLDAISSLSYRTYVDPSSQANDNLAPVIEMMVDVDNNGSRDTTFIFEPVYSAAQQGAVQKGVWQTWNARAGTWRVSRSVGPILTDTYFSYDTFVAAFPDAKIVQWFPRADGFGLGTVVGQSSGGGWANFVGNVDGFEIGVNNASTINDYELALPAISIDDASFTEGDSVIAPHFNVTLSGVSSQIVTVAYATADGTAQAGSDYTATSGTLTFAPGETTQPVVVNIIGDTAFEPSETFFVNLSNPTNATIADGQGVGTINDNEAMPAISINDVFVSEPTAGTSTATFTVTLSGAAANNVTVTYATADGTATAPADYTAIPPTTLTFTPGQTSQTVTVAIQADNLSEGNETFTVELSNPSSNATLADPTGQGTITDPVTGGQLLISEFRFRGKTFSAPQNIGGERDEFVELYNNTNSPLTVATTDGSQGWTLAALNASGTGIDVLVTIPNGTVIPARGHYLAVNSDETLTAAARKVVPAGGIVPTGGYSLNNYAVGDDFYVTDVADDAGVAVFNTATPANFTFANQLDAAGFNVYQGATADLFREGVGLPSPGANDGEYAFVRHMETGLPQDHNENAEDFVFVATNGAAYGGVQSVLGAPGPENCGCHPQNQFTGSPVQRNATIKASLIEPLVLSTLPPNRIRDTTATGPNATLGTLEIRRRFTNNTGAPVTALRFRVVDVTTLNTPNPGGVQADLRWLSSSDTTVTTSRGLLTVRGTVLETPPTQPSGGGLNTSGRIVGVGTLSPGASVDVRFVLGVQTSGRFRFFVNVEGLP